MNFSNSVIAIPFAIISVGLFYYIVWQAGKRGIITVNRRNFVMLIVLGVITITLVFFALLTDFGKY